MIELPSYLIAKGRKISLGGYQKYGVTLAELIVAVALLGVVILGVTSFDLASRYFLKSSENKTRVVNELAFILQHISKYTLQASGDGVNRGIGREDLPASNQIRLHIRQDNADRRLYGVAAAAGLLSDEKKRVLESREGQSRLIREILRDTVTGGERLEHICRRTGVTAEWIRGLTGRLSEMDISVLESVMLDEKYSGYIERNLRRFRARNDISGVSLKSIASYMEIEEICWEAREVLEKAKPDNLAQAGKLPGVRPTDINGLLIHLSRSCSTWNTDR